MWIDLAVPWQACLEEAWTAFRAGSMPIGAVGYSPEFPYLKINQRESADYPKTASAA